MNFSWTLERVYLRRIKNSFINIVYITLIRWGDGLFDSFRLGTDSCSIDIFVLDDDDRTVVADDGGGGCGGGGVGGERVGLGLSNL